MLKLPLVVDISRFSMEDGPGIRSVVFFKGCPLSCVFCHNPETQKPSPEIAFTRNRCIECGACLLACPRKAIDLKYYDRIHRDKCNACGKCAEVCPSEALKLLGRYYSVKSLTSLLMRDLEYYRNSGGGVTLSGGECASFPKYLNKLLKNLKKVGIHIVIETAGDFYYEEFKSLVVPYVDLIYYDIKLANNEFHEKYCGRPNTRILQNLFDLFKDGQVKVQPRIPLIPGITDTRQNLSRISSLLRDHGQTEVSILPYNPAGLAKYETLGRPIPELPSNFMRPKEIDKARAIISGKSPLSQTRS